jgi:acetyltransferase-like isoleucine patch superfamily enzyme
MMFIQQEGISEKQKMLVGDLYNGSDPELTAERAKTEALSRLYNYGSADKPGSDPGVLKQLLGNLGKNATIRAPFYCDYGWNIFLGDGTFVNFNAVPKRPSDPKERAREWQAHYRVTRHGSFSRSTRRL